MVNYRANLFSLIAALSICYSKALSESKKESGIPRKGITDNRRQESHKNRSK
jgi:organic hydroperoxide reductase OsmC/OhrA